MIKGDVSINIEQKFEKAVENDNIYYQELANGEIKLSLVVVDSKYALAVVKYTDRNRVRYDLCCLEETDEVDDELHIVRSFECEDNAMCAFKVLTMMEEM